MFQAEWTVDELAQTLKVPPSTLRRRISFWQTQGLIHEASTDVFKLIEEGPMRRMSGVSGKSYFSNLRYKIIYEIFIELRVRAFRKSALFIQLETHTNGLIK